MNGKPTGSDNPTDDNETKIKPEEVPKQKVQRALLTPSKVFTAPKKGRT